MLSSSVSQYTTTIAWRMKRLPGGTGSQHQEARNHCPDKLHPVWGCLQGAAINKGLSGFYCKDIQKKNSLVVKEQGALLCDILKANLTNLFGKGKDNG